MNSQPARTRFAPSPTGFLHVGGIRTALFAWLVAKQSGGQFILRLEDTDKTREVSGSAEHIMDSLKWLGISWDEGPDINGQFGPYKQSDRLDIYKNWANKLIQSGRAYADPYTTEEVEEFRKQSQLDKKPFLFRNYRPTNPPEWDGSQPLRFLSDPKAYDWEDAVMGKLHAGEEAVDDFILIKSDGYPTYNFAHIVDDAEMQITHVIRSQEFVSSTPRFLNLYDALGIDAPILATLPFVMAIDGKKKLGKRDGAKDVLDYAREGILPEAMLNFLASLGWNDGTEQEIFSVEELIAKFSLDRVQKSPARFDEQRLWWMNGMHIRKMSLDELYEMTDNRWPEEAGDATADYKRTVLSLLHERLKKLDELKDLSWFFFKDPVADASIIELIKTETKQDSSTINLLINKTVEQLTGLGDFKANTIQDTLYNLALQQNTKPADLFKVVRIALVGGTVAPGLFETISTLGKETTLRRLNHTCSQLNN